MMHAGAMHTALRWFTLNAAAFEHPAHGQCQCHVIALSTWQCTNVQQLVGKCLQDTGKGPGNVGD